MLRWGRHRAGTISPGLAGWPHHHERWWWLHSTDQQGAVGRKVCLGTGVSISVSATSNLAAFGPAAWQICHRNFVTFARPPWLAGLPPSRVSSHVSGMCELGLLAGGLSPEQGHQHQQWLLHSHTWPRALPEPSGRDRALHTVWWRGEV